MTHPLLPNLSEDKAPDSDNVKWMDREEFPQEDPTADTLRRPAQGVKEQLVASIVHELQLKEDQTQVLLMKLLNYAELFDSKQHDYGSANISMFGEYGVLVRLNDKLQRLINLQKRADAPANESIEDTWRDIGGYGFIGEMLHNGEWAS